MITSLHISSVYVLDQDQALDFYVDTLGLEVKADQDLGFMRWLTVGPAGEDRQILLELPGPPSMDPATGERVRELVAKGAGGGGLFFTTDDARATYAELSARGVEFTDEPTDRGYGIDFGLRDPFGNSIRVAQLAAEGLSG
ncbi:MAG: VOC family protein [Thermoleophilia bacterium]